MKKSLPLHPETLNEQIASDVIMYSPERNMDEDTITAQIRSTAQICGYVIGDARMHCVHKLVSDHLEAIYD